MKRQPVPSLAGTDDRVANSDQPAGSFPNRGSAGAFATCGAVDNDNPYLECVLPLGHSGPHSDRTETRLFRTIVADPPWPIQWSVPETRINGRGERHPVYKRDLGYTTMSVDGIKALLVEDLAEANANLFLWTPERFLFEGVAAAVVRAWGFEPKRTLIWRKSGFGLGTFPRPQHESLLVATRGSLPFQIKDAGSVQDWGLVYENGCRKHSAKPDAALDLIERASPGPYLELFARRARFGWDYWGDESLQTVELPAA